MNQELMPFVRGSETSRDAAVAIKPHAATLRAKVYDAIFRAGYRGLTDDEVQRQLRMDGSTERPRRRELERSGVIVKTDNERRTHSGRPAAVWIAKTFAEIPAPTHEQFIG